MINKQDLLDNLKSLAAQAMSERHKAVDARMKQHEIDKREAYWDGICKAISIVDNHKVNPMETIEYPQFLANLYFYARNEDEKEYAMEELNRLKVNFTVRCFHGKKKTHCELCKKVEEFKNVK